MVYQMDVKSAFLYETIEEEVYAPRAWYETLAAYLLENGSHRGKIDQTLFIKKHKGDILLVQIYVDDIIFGVTNKDLCKSFEKLMKNRFQMSSMGELTFFLGLQVKQKKDGIFISQDKYVAEILKKFGLTEGKSASTPIDTEKPLLKDPDGEDVDVHIYRSMIGSLMYLTSSRPDIMFAVCACARFQVTSKALQLHAVKRIFRYLKGKPRLGLWYPNDSPFDLVAYSDSDYAVVATSSTEAKYVAAASCCAQSNDVTRLQALVERKKLVITEDAIRDVLCLDDANGVDCLPNEEIFAELARMGYEKPLVRNVDNSSKFYMYPRFIQLVIQNQLGDLSTHTIKYTSPALTQKVFANMRRVGKGFSGVETPLFEGMLVAGEIEEQGDAEEQVQDNVDDAAQGADTAVHHTPPQSPPPQPQSPSPAQPPAADFPMSLLQEALDACASLTRRFEHLEHDKVAQALEITKLKKRVKKLERAIKVKVLKLRRLKKKAEDAQVAGDEQVKRRQTEIYQIDMDHASKVLSMHEYEPEVQEVVKVVTTAKLITEVVVAVSESVTAASATTAAVPTATIIATPIRVSIVIDHVKQKAKEDSYVQRYQVMKKRPQTEAQARRNMIMYLKNVAGFRLDYFKGMSYDDIRLIFKAKFNSNIEFLLKSKEQIEEEENRAIESIKETPAQKATKMRKLNEEVEDLKQHLEIVLDEDDDVTVHGQARVKSWKLLESCGVHIITFTTTQLILLVERRNPLSRFTLDQMLNAVRLRVEDQSEMSLELLRGDDAVDDDEQMRLVGKQIGFYFDACDASTQERKRESFESFSFRSLWPSPFVDFVFSSSEGTSAGLITLWDRHSFSMEHKAVNRNFVEIIGSWVGISSKSPFSIDMVKDAVWGCDGSKAPGPDGFSFKIFKTFWDVLKVDFLECVKHFEANATSRLKINLAKSRLYGISVAIEDVTVVVSSVGRALNNLTSFVELICNTTLFSDGVEKWSWSYEASDISRLATRPSLVARGISIADPSCRFCNQSTEDVHHVLVACPRVARVWRKVWAWWNLDMPNVFLFFLLIKSPWKTFTTLGVQDETNSFMMLRFLYGLYGIG
uniref:Reverse transcriptase Ty1/copia-type domain-containing protein n=1 Tax=Tanacetum cinerariifolium TaxID=118510 RepID=A0A699GXW1_TANCI|nr:hypothetical protein [Tanacetum cinerariifolium]